MDLWTLCRDSGNALGFRFRSPSEYRYNAAIILVVSIAIGCASLPPIAPLFPNPIVIAVLGVIYALRWLILAHSMAFVAQRFHRHAQTLPLAGYTLATEALSIPTIFVVNQPDWTGFLIFWQIWTLIVQMEGFRAIAKIPLRIVVLGYALYTIGLITLIFIMFLILYTIGAIDINAIIESMPHINRQTP